MTWWHSEFIDAPTQGQIDIIEHFGFDARHARHSPRWGGGWMRLRSTINRYCPDVVGDDGCAHVVVDHPRAFQWVGGRRIVILSPYIPIDRLLANEGFKQLREAIKDTWNVFVFHPSEFNAYWSEKDIATFYPFIATIVFVKR